MSRYVKCIKASKEMKSEDVILLHSVTRRNTKDAHEKLRIFLQNGGDPNSCITRWNGMTSTILMNAFKNGR